MFEDEKDEDTTDEGVSFTSLDKWQDVNFTGNATRRNHGVKWDAFIADMALYQTALSSLPPYDSQKIRAEISDWDRSIPDQDELDIRELQGAYSRLVNYRWRVAEMIARVNNHYQMFSHAYKVLGKAAVALGSGTGPDKTAYAEHLVADIAKGIIGPKIMLDELGEVKGSLEFAAANMARSLREREVMSKINPIHMSEGSVHEFEKKTGLNAAYYSKERGASGVRTLRRSSSGMTQETLRDQDQDDPEAL